MARPKAPPNQMAPLRDAIRRRIAELGLTQQEAADLLGMDRRLLTHYQNHLNSLPGPERWRRLVDVLGLDASEILARVGYLEASLDIG